MTTFFIIFWISILGFALYQAYAVNKKIKRIDVEMRALVKFDNWFNKMGLEETRNILLTQFKEYKKHQYLIESGLKRK